MSNAAVNPLLGPWAEPFGLPPFAAIEAAHFRPAFAAALATHQAEIEAVASDPRDPGFADTVEALELSGRDLRRVAAVFFNLAGADTTPELQAIEREMAPLLARHRNAIYQDARLFARIAALVERADALALSPEQARLLERYHTAFVRSGAALDAAGRARLGAIDERLASLATAFAQNVLADEQAYALVLDGEADLAGLPAYVRDAAASAAAALGHEGRHVITLSRSSIEPFLAFSSRRDLREAAFLAWIARGEGGGESDNPAIIAETLALRRERAALLGYASYAHFRTADSMAGTPEAVRDLLDAVWRPARDRALADSAVLAGLVRAEGGNHELAPWDWRYFAEKRRQTELAIAPGAAAPYLPLDAMIAAAFHTAERLFGLTFTERTDLELYHPDVRAWVVSDPDGRHKGLFLADYFARPSKRSGAWMSGFRTQEKLAGEIHPIVVNVMNFAKPTGDAPALLGFEEARTLFHEFGHALHGLLSDVTYPMLSGTSVDRDFVELPSQLFEHWLATPEVLTRFARHYQTGEPMPPALLDALQAARRLDQPFATVEYLASALVDLELHRDAAAEGQDSTDLERQLLTALGMPEAIVMRHRPPHFAHIFAGGYASGYYSYMWSEVLDADAFEAFEEAGDPFDPELAKRLETYILATGNSIDPAAAYRGFRGRDARPEALLEKRGLVATD